MKNTLLLFTILVLNLISTCSGQNPPVTFQEPIINEFDTKSIASGEYKFRFVTSNNNIKRQESGYLDDDGNLVVRGYYSFIDPDGEKHYVAYTADKNGYKTIDKILIPSGFYSGVPSSIVASLLGK